MGQALRTLLASLALALAGSVTLAAATGNFRAFTSESARRLEVRAHPVAVPDVLLQDQSGRKLRLSDLRGKWLLVDFIYTRCPTVCRSLGADFAQLQSLLGQDNVQMLSISFDPQHDNPAALADYLRRSKNHGPSWRAASPTDAQGLDQIKRAFGITVIPDELGGYTHNTAIHAVDPEGRLVDIFDLGNPALIAQALRERIQP